jgi:phasin family protein
LSDPILSATQDNINAIFEYMQEACNAKSMPELMELSNKYARQNMEMMTEQAKEITDAVQKAAVESTRPLTGFANTFGRMS